MLRDAFDRISDSIERDWQSIARKEQLVPEDDKWSIFLLMAGRGFGKSLAGAQWVRSLAESGKAERIALVGPTAADIRDTMILGQSGLMSITPNSFRPLYEPSKRRLIYPNGVQAHMFSSEEPERLRGPNFSAAWLDELGAWRNVQETFDQLQFGLRLGRRPRQMITTTPRALTILKDLVKRANDGTGDVILRRGSTYDNAANLAPSFLSTIVKRYENTRLGKQELDGLLLEDVEGALWTRDMIEAARIQPSAMWQEMKRVVVAIDPAVSVGENSDETGIIVAGLGFDDRAYVLEDLSGKYSPIEWATKAVGAYKRNRADRIISETNMGGQMVEATIRAVDPNVPYKGVHAKRGKLIRAEPVSALYEQRRVVHVGMFAELEDQLTGWQPGSSDSPDRLDALVYAVTDLTITPQRAQFVFG